MGAASGVLPRLFSFPALSAPVDFRFEVHLPASFKDESLRLPGLPFVLTIIPPDMNSLFRGGWISLASSRSRAALPVSRSQTPPFPGLYCSSVLIDSRGNAATFQTQQPAGWGVEFPHRKKG